MASQEKENGQLGHWVKVLNIADWEILQEKISPLQVSDDCGRPNNNLVGIVVCKEEKSATLFYTRKLKLDDIIHELLHVAHPEWPHELVVAETQRLSQEHTILKNRFPD